MIEEGVAYRCKVKLNVKKCKTILNILITELILLHIYSGQNKFAVRKSIDNGSETSAVGVMKGDYLTTP